MKLISKIGVMIATRKAEGFKLPGGKKLTQKNIAMELGVLDGQVTGWVKGTQHPRPMNLFHLAHLLNCKVDDLMEFVPPTEEEREQMIKERLEEERKKEAEKIEKKIIEWRKKGYSEEWIEEEVKKLKGEEE
jgi:transcriptional regulator with XRE-family HTH domain